MLTQEPLDDSHRRNQDWTRVTGSTEGRQGGIVDDLHDKVSHSAGLCLALLVDGSSTETGM